jgi:hypothetical protein
LASVISHDCDLIVAWGRELSKPICLWSKAGEFFYLVIFGHIWSYLLRFTGSEFRLQPSAFGLYGPPHPQGGQGKARPSRLAAPGAHDGGVPHRYPPLSSVIQRYPP